MTCRNAAGTQSAPATVTVTVVPAVVQTAVVLHISPESSSVDIGSTTKLSVTATDRDGNPIATPADLEWTSANDNIATVDDGVVTGAAVGDTTITVTDPESMAHASAAISVSAISIPVSPASPTVMVDSTTTLTVTASDSSGAIATPSDLEWTSSNPAIATVDDGEVTGVAAGSATITVTDPVSMATASASISVSSISLTISPFSPFVVVGAMTSLTVTASDASGTIATPPNLQWTSSASSIASVSNGIVTGVSFGTAIITAEDPVSLAISSVAVDVGLPDPGTAQSVAQIQVSGQTHSVTTGCTNPARDGNFTTPIDQSYNTPPPFFGESGANFYDNVSFEGLAISSNPFSSVVESANYPLTSSTTGTATKYSYSFSESGTTFTEKITIEVQYNGPDYGDFNMMEDDTQVFQSVFSSATGVQTASYSFTRAATGTDTQSGLDVGCSIQIDTSYSGTGTVQYH